MKDVEENYMLVVEDSDEDFEALKRVMAKSCDIHIPITRCVDGDEVLDFVSQKTAQHKQQTKPYQRPVLPSLILLDLNLPGTDGREVLAQLKQDTKTCSIPIVIFTTSSDPKDIEACYRDGANSYLIKPMRVEQLKASVCVFINYWFTAAVLPTHAAAM